MASADFSSLYSNIDHEDCINNLTDFFKDKLESEHFFFFILFFYLYVFSCNNLKKFTFMHFFINKKFKNSKMLIITTIS